VSEEPVVLSPARIEVLDEMLAALPIAAFGGRRRILSDVTEPAAVVAILEHLGLPARAPKGAPARNPGWFEAA
jgi:hypothetical protein